jgi:mono/diheme cytochrome c family protein
MDYTVEGKVAMTTKVLVGVMFALMLTSAMLLAQTLLGPVEKGERVYQRNCLRCHGAALDGKGPDAVSLAVPPADFHRYLSRLKHDAEFEKTIKQGKKFLGMHNWEDILTDEQVRDLIAYIRSAAPHAQVKP